MSKLLLLSWREVVRALGKVGFKIGRQTSQLGSEVWLSDLGLNMLCKRIEVGGLRNRPCCSQ